MTRAALASTAAAAALAALAALAGCEAPPLRIAFDLTAGPVQACPATSCSDVPMLCDAVLNVRILRPTEPLAPFLSLCEAVPPNRNRDVCSIASIDLPARELPNETLEVQVMIWPLNAVKQDPMTGELDCHEIYGTPTSVAFDLHGFPEEAAPAPALGGHAFFHPGDEQTVVTLGCSDLQSVNEPACFGSSSIEVSARVNDFKLPTLPVIPSVAANLLVSVGEPRYDGDLKAYVFGPGDKKQLKRSNDSTSAIPAWGDFLDDFRLDNTVCIEVYEDVGSTTATVRCRAVTSAELKLSLVGVYLDAARLQTIRQMALGLPDFPQQGLTIGVVLDDHGTPAPNVRIATPDKPSLSVKYLSADGTAVISGGTATSTSGLFVSEDAPYSTRFDAEGQQGQTATGLGGRIRGKVTIVMLQLGQLAGG